MDVFTKRQGVPQYARLVSFEDIEKNDFNLNLPRYIDSQTPEDQQDIADHLQGGIPTADVDALHAYWAVCPQLRQSLFKANCPGHLDLAVSKTAIQPAIYEHPEFAAFISCTAILFDQWCDTSAHTLKGLQRGGHPKHTITALAEDLLAHYTGQALIAHYDVYQHLMDYWAQTLQDDVYLMPLMAGKPKPTA